MIHTQKMHKRTPTKHNSKKTSVQTHFSLASHCVRKLAVEVRKVIWELLVRAVKCLCLLFMKYMPFFLGWCG